MKGRGQQLDGYHLLGSLAGRDRGPYWVARGSEDPGGGPLYVVRPISKPEHGPAEKKKLIEGAEAASEIVHPHIARIHDVIEHREDRLVYLVSEFVQGESLAEVMRVGGAFPRMVAVGVAARIARVLDDVQSNASPKRRLIHGDLAPWTIMFTHEGNLKLVDYSVSDLTRRSIDQPNHPYMAPEQIEHASSTQDPRADVYALGRVLNEMIAAARPQRTPVSISEKRARTARTRSMRELDEIIARATAPKMSDRYFDAGELSKALELFLKTRAPGHDTRAHVAGVMSRFQHRARATRRLVERWTSQPASVLSAALKLPAAVSVPASLVPEGREARESQEAPQGREARDGREAHESREAREAEEPRTAVLILAAVEAPLEAPALPFLDHDLGPDDGFPAEGLGSSSATTDDILASRTNPGSLRPRRAPPRLYIAIAFAIFLLALAGLVLAALDLFT